VAGPKRTGHDLQPPPENSSASDSFLPHKLITTDRSRLTTSPVSGSKAVADAVTLAFPPANREAARPWKSTWVVCTSTLQGVVPVHGTNTEKNPLTGKPPRVCLSSPDTVTKEGCVPVTKPDKKLWRNRKEKKELVRRLQSENPGLEVVHPHAAQFSDQELTQPLIEPLPLREDRDSRQYATAQTAATTKHSVQMLQRILMDCWAGKCLAQRTCSDWRFIPG
jgi:hypothetical protein